MQLYFCLCSSGPATLQNEYHIQCKMYWQKCCVLKGRDVIEKHLSERNAISEHSGELVGSHLNWSCKPEKWPFKLLLTHFPPGQPQGPLSSLLDTQFWSRRSLSHRSYLHSRSACCMSELGWCSVLQQRGCFEDDQMLVCVFVYVCLCCDSRQQWLKMWNFDWKDVDSIVSVSWKNCE